MIRHAEETDMPVILEVYRIARAFMAAHGNTVQWQNNHPSREILDQDIDKGHLYVYENKGKVHGVFAFIPGEDPTYGAIEGEWMDESPYAAIHRVASDGTEKGVFAKIAEYCKKEIPHLRIDTHERNLPMQGAVQKCGFHRCGIIHIADGSPRIAYEYVEKLESAL